MTSAGCPIFILTEKVPASTIGQIAVPQGHNVGGHLRWIDA